MHFKVNITSEADFQKWVNDAQKLNKPLTKAHYYEKLLPPTKNNPVETTGKKKQPRGLLLVVSGTELGFIELFLRSTVETTP